MPRIDAEPFFNRMNNVVAKEFAASFVYHENRNREFQGDGKVIVVTTPSDTRRLFLVNHAVLYSDQYTKARWSGSTSRASQIANLEPGGVISFNNRGSILTFVKTQDAANIELNRLREVDSHGVPFNDDELIPKQFAEIAGLKHRSIGKLVGIDLNRTPAFYLSMSPDVPDDAELERITQELIGEMGDKNPFLP